MFFGDDDAEVVAVEAALPGVVAVDEEPLPLVVAATTAGVVGAAVEPPAVAVAACCATKAEFKRGLRVEVPEGWVEDGKSRRHGLDSQNGSSIGT